MVNVGRLRDSSLDRTINVREKKREKDEKEIEEGKEMGGQGLTTSACLPRNTNKVRNLVKYNFFSSPSPDGPNYQEAGIKYKQE